MNLYAPFILTSAPPQIVCSHTSASCEREISTKVLAAGCTTSSSFMIVAPSLEMVVLPAEANVNNFKVMTISFRAAGFRREQERRGDQRVSSEKVTLALYKS